MSRFGVVAALEPEIRTLRKLPDDFAVAVAGMGAERAYGAARRLIDGGATALVSWGSAAALDPGLASGTLLVPEVVEAEGASYRPDAGWRHAIVAILAARHSVNAGALVESPRMLANAEMKRALAQSSGAVAADMESGGVARAAHESGVPFIAIRAVADRADVAVPPHLARTVAADGSLSFTAGIARLAVSPWHWAAALRLGLGFNDALLALRAAAPALYASASSIGLDQRLDRQRRNANARNSGAPTAAA